MKKSSSGWPWCLPAVALRAMAGMGVLAVNLPPPAAGQSADEAFRKLRVAPGLKAALWAGEPRLENPVGFDIDARGRIFVAETHRLRSSVLDIRDYMQWLDDDLACRTVEDREAMSRKWFGADCDAKLRNGAERVKLLEDTDGDGVADRDVEYAGGFDTILDGLGTDVLARGSDVWFTNIPSLWLLRDTDGDGKADVRKELHRGYGVRFGFTGHDLHAIRMGPDGKLYFTIGDRGLHVTAPDGKVISFPDGGACIRCNPDGTEPELFATGLRNPQGLVFDDYGNLWTCDNTCDQGDQPRWTYIVEGADYGWRIGYQFLSAERDPWMAEKIWRAEQEAPYRVPAVGHIGHGPSGITCDPGVTALPEKYRGCFLTTDFPGGIHAFRVKPKGAGFEMVDRSEFLWEYYPTDVEFGPDGAVYASDWVNGWSMGGKGAIYRVFDPARLSDPAVLEVKKILGEGMKKWGVDELELLIAHRDRRIRLEAQFELVSRNATGLLARIATKSKNLLSRLHAIWGLGQILAKTSVTKDKDEIFLLLLPLIEDDDAEIRAQTAKVFGDRRVHDADLHVAQLLTDPQPRVRFFAALSLGKMGKKHYVQQLFEMLRVNADADPWLRHAGVMGLAGTRDIDSLLEFGGANNSRSCRLASLLALRRLRKTDAKWSLYDDDPAIVFEAVRAIHDTPIPKAMPELAELLNFTGTPDAAMTRVINAAYRVGTPEQAVALAAYAGRHEAPEPLRREALEALRMWERPPGRDRVVGLWRPLPPRDAAPARDALAAVVEGLLRENPEGVRLEAARSAAALGITGASPILASIARDPGCGPSLRAEALRGLAGLKGAGLGDAVSAALADPDASVRGEAVRLLPTVQGTGVAARLESIAGDDALPASVRQSALAALGGVPGDEARAAIRRLLDLLLDGKIPPPLRLDLLEAASKRTPEAIKDRLAKWEASLPKDDPLAPYRVAIEGGDAEAGRKIFRERQDVQCTRCHKIGGEGGEVGPPLDGIGGKRKREEFLESILLPNAKIAEGYGQVLVQTKDEKTLAGRVEKETDAELVLLTPDGKRETIAKAEIASRAQGKSAMPEDFAKKLSRRDLRDLVEFLADLK